MSEDIFVPTGRDILKVHISPHGLDFIKTTLLHGFIGDTPLRSDCTCPALPLSISPSLFLSDTTLTAHGVASQSRHCARRTPRFSPRCEPSSTGNTLHQGYNLGRRPGAMLIRFVFQISAPPMRLYLAEETRCSNHLHFTPAAKLYHTDRLQRGTLKSRIGYPSPSSPSLSIKMAGLGGESQTCDTHQI